MPNDHEGREPDGEQAAEQASAGEAEESGLAATLEAMRSPAKYRLSEDELDERDAAFSGPRKEQGPLEEDGQRHESLAEEESEEAVEETPPPAPGDEETPAE